VIFVLLYFSLL